MLATHSFSKHESRQIESQDIVKGVTANNSSLEPLLNIDEAARIIGRAHWTLRRDIKSGKITCVRIGRRIMIEKREIRRVIEEGREVRF